MRRRAESYLPTNTAKDKSLEPSYSVDGSYFMLLSFLAVWNTHSISFNNKLLAQEIFMDFF